MRSHQVEINGCIPVPFASLSVRGAVPGGSIPSRAATDATVSAQTHSQLSVNYNYSH